MIAVVHQRDLLSWQLLFLPIQRVGFIVASFTVQSTAAGVPLADLGIFFSLF